MAENGDSFLYEMPGITAPPVKLATEEQLLKWRKSVLALNSSRRFRYAANVSKRKQDLEARKASFRSRALVIQAAQRFIDGGRRRSTREGKEKDDVDLSAKETDLSEGEKKGGFGVSDKQLARMMEKDDVHILEKLGGPEGVAKSLKVDPQDGIPGDDADINSRKEIFGSNTYPEKASKGFLVFLWEAFQDVTLFVLMVCAFISLAVGIATEGIESGWYDGAGILVSITLVVMVTAITDYQQSLQFQSLNKEKQKIYINVTRGGRRQKVLIFDLVVGDIVHLSIGDQVPADGVVVESNSLTVDESQMTGESEPKKKGPDEPFLMSGCKIADGGGRMMIVAVGMNTEWGRLMSTLSSDDTEETPLQVRLNSVATMIGKLGLSVAVLVFFILIGKFLYKKNFDFSDWSGGDTLEVVNFFAIAVTIIVVSVPEGLPLAVTLTLAFAMHKMMEQKALVRHLSACETMGSSTTICSDKTGTLTMNEMTVVKAWVSGKVHDDPAGAVKELPKEALEILTEAMCYNTSGDVYVPEGESEPEVSGSPTEAAILKFALAIKTDFKGVRSSGKVLNTEPFSSAKKRMGVIVEKNGKARVHWKGASEIVLGLCDQVTDNQGKPVKLTKEKKDELLKVIEDMAKASLRTIAFGYREVSSPGGDSVPEDKLICQLIVGIKDPPRPGVKNSIKLCHKAGIVVRMVTGDNLTTAQAISKEIGILDQGGEIIEGPKFRELSEDQMRDLVPKLRVMARSSPTDKNLLVKHLRAHGEVVAATGDGTNDAPALHEADIGLAMGIAGTEVAKESADVVILDDNFSTIVNVAKWGRSVYANIQKFVQFQLTVNIVALMLNFISAAITGAAPLTAVQLLWVNLIMDTLGALALATEPPTDELMTQAPVGRHSSLITNIMWRNIFGMAAYQLVVLLVLQFEGRKLLGLGKSDHDTLVLQTVIFNSFVLCQVFNEFNARHTERINIFRNLIGNHVFLGVIAFTVLVQSLLVQVGGFVGQIASTTPLSLKFWAICVGLGFLSMPIAALLKCVPVPRKPMFARSKSARRRDGGSDYHALPGGEQNGGAGSV